MQLYKIVNLKWHCHKYIFPFAGKWQKINNDPVCFGTRDDTYGAFNITKTGVVKSIKLVHRNGSVKCHLKHPSKFWSCGNIGAYANNTFMTIITNANREALLPSVENMKAHGCNVKEHFYVLDGVNQGSPELILGNLSRPLSLLKDQQLQIWYGQDWIDCSEYNNNGTSCVDIFAWYVWEWQGGFTIKLRKISTVLCLIFEIAVYIVWSPLFRVVEIKEFFEFHVDWVHFGYITRMTLSFNNNVFVSHWK